ncbi:MAG: serpin family protein [Bryobacteraceae bacterium]|jgi:serpin B
MPRTPSFRLVLPFLAAAALHAADSPITAGLNHFATASYQELARGGDNLILSPFSISTALSMVLEGARGQTAAEMAKVLHQPYPDPGYDAALASLVDQLTKLANTSGNELLDANGLWVQRGFPLESDFERSIQTLYRAPLTQLDFLKNPEQARAEINSWTGQHTKGKIPELFGPGSVDSSTRLILTSAIYFLGKWQSPFQPTRTHAAPFKLAAGGTVEASFMNQTAAFGYAETPLVQILEMKYGGTPLAFDILLPKTEHGLAELETSINPENLAAWLGALRDCMVEAAIPKFRAESEFSLRDTLSHMGMPGAFSRTADFSGVDGRRDLFLSVVMHKAFVDVSEEGTEAAAATGAAMSLVSMRVAQRTVFRADHPFIFLIRDTPSGLILFAGRLVKPR